MMQLHLTSLPSASGPRRGHAAGVGGPGAWAGGEGAQGSKPATPASRSLRPCDACGAPVVAQEARDLGISQLCPRADLLTPAAVSRARQAGFSVRAWGLKTDEVRAAMWAVRPPLRFSPTALLRGGASVPSCGST